MAKKTEAAAANKLPNNDTLIDTTLETPTEVDGEKVVGYPKTIHILFNKDVMEFANQYRDALYTARGIPFDMNAITPADILALVVANQSGMKKAITSDEAVRRAKQIYSKWAEIADQHSWTLAILYDNELDHQPRPYPPAAEKKFAPGI